jgi:hypothetical protein
MPQLAAGKTHSVSFIQQSAQNQAITPTPLSGAIENFTSMSVLSFGKIKPGIQGITIQQVLGIIRDCGIGQ